MGQREHRICGCGGDRIRRSEMAAALHPNTHFHHFWLLPHFPWYSHHCRNPLPPEGRVGQFSVAYATLNCLTLWLRTPVIVARPGQAPRFVVARPRGPGNLAAADISVEEDPDSRPRATLLVLAPPNIEDVLPSLGREEAQREILRA